MAKRAAGKISKQREIEKKKRKKRKSTLIIMVIILLVGGISAYLLTSPNFAIQEISINGNNKVTRQQILKLADIQKGDNLFSKIGIVMKVKLKQNGYIENAEFNKILPNKIEINISERQQQFQIKTEEGYIYIDEQGYILEYAKDMIQMPVITGMSIKDNEVSKLNRLSEIDLEKMENVLQIREQFKNIQMADKITGYEVSDEYTIRLENEGITIKLGDASNLQNRMYYVNAIIKQESGNRGIIHVDGNLNEGFSAYFSAE